MKQKLDKDGFVPVLLDNWIKLIGSILITLALVGSTSSLWAFAPLLIILTLK